MDALKPALLLTNRDRTSGTRANGRCGDEIRRQSVRRKRGSYPERRACTLSVKWNAGNKVAVVVSAMAGATNQLVAG